jgi:hypothetical protein
MLFRVFWDVVPCGHVEVARRFRDMYCLHHQGEESPIALMMEEACTSETSVNFNVITRCYIPEDPKIHTPCRGNLKYQFIMCFMIKITP